MDFSNIPLCAGRNPAHFLNRNAQVLYEHKEVIVAPVCSEKTNGSVHTIITNISIYRKYQLAFYKSVRYLIWPVVIYDVPCRIVQKKYCMHGRLALVFLLFVFF